MLTRQSHTVAFIKETSLLLGGQIRGQLWTPDSVPALLVQRLPSFTFLLCETGHLRPHLAVMKVMSTSWQSAWQEKGVEPGWPPALPSPHEITGL